MVRFASAALLLSLAATPALAAVDGAQVFATQCKMCHQGASNALAPSLAGVAGAKIAARDDFAYSPALKAKADETWTDANLDAFLKSPTAFAPGAKMFLGPQSDENRAAVIGYLHALK
jgi:cytochrome c